MKFYFFYILRSLKNNKLYLGYTTDLKKRLKQHNSGSELATKPNIPYEMIHFSGFKNMKDAKNMETYYKTISGWKRLKHMLKNTLN